MRQKPNQNEADFTAVYLQLSQNKWKQISRLKLGSFKRFPYFAFATNVHLSLY